MSEKKKEGFNFNPFIVMGVMVLLCTIASWLVTPGAYDRELVNGINKVIATSYHSVARTPVGFLDMFAALPAGLNGAGLMMFVVMLVGGTVEIYKRTGIMGAGINSLLHLSKRIGGAAIIAIITCAFFIIGGVVGWSEQIIPFVPIVVSLAISLGYDSLVGITASGLACLISFAVAPFNLFTVGTAHTIAELPMFSGWELRTITDLIICALWLFWLIRYANKIKKDPSQSLMKDYDTSSLVIPVDEGNKLDGVKTISLLVLAVSFGIVVYGALNLKWSWPQIGAVFMICGIITAALNKLSPTETVNYILDGMRGAMEGALIIGAARAVQVVLTNGGLVDPLVHWMSTFMQGSSAYISTCVMFIANFFINALIPSGSGQAMAVMPLMVPLADLLHITRQTATLAFQFGDGISNTLWFTNGTLLIYCALGKVPLKVWYKFILPLQGIYFLLEFGVLYFAIASGYGPF